MRDDEGGEAELKAQEHEQQHHRNAGDNLRIDDGNVGNIDYKRTQLFVEFVNAYCRGSTDDSGYDAGDNRNYQRIAQRREYLLIMKQIPIPFEGEARPIRAALGLVEGIGDQHAYGHIEERHHKPDIGFGKPFHSSSPPSSSSPNWLKMLMQSRIRTISTSDIAAPRFGL